MDVLAVALAPAVAALVSACGLLWILRVPPVEAVVPVRGPIRRRRIR